MKKTLVLVINMLSLVGAHAAFADSPITTRQLQAELTRVQNGKSKLEVAVLLTVGDDGRSAVVRTSLASVKEGLMLSARMLTPGTEPVLEVGLEMHPFVVFRGTRSYNPEIACSICLNTEGPVRLRPGESTTLTSVRKPNGKTYELKLTLQ